MNDRAEAAGEGAEGAGGRGATQRDQAEIEFSRIVAFSDGVFAIAITLLVLGLEIPPGTTDLGAALRDRGSELFAYAISFAVLGRLWIVHHRFFSSIARFDTALMALNLLYLAWIALVPFTSEMLGDFADQPQAVIVYAINIAAINLVFAAQIAHSGRRGLLRPSAGAFAGRRGTATSLVVAGVFFASIPVALVSPTAGTLVWLSMFVFGHRASALVAGGR